MIYSTGVNRLLHGWMFLEPVVGRLLRTVSTVGLSNGLILLWIQAIGFNTNASGDLFISFGVALTTAFAVGLF